jgi:hypothetical protein
MIQDWIDFHPGIPEEHHFELPFDTFCAELEQRPIPVLPSVISHGIETSVFPARRTDSGRFEYDANNNKMSYFRTHHGEPEGDLFDVPNLYHYRIDFDPPSCTRDTITQDLLNKDPRLANLIDLQNRKLKPLTEGGYFPSGYQANWLYGGHRIIRDIFTEVWFVQVDFHFDPPRPPANIVRHTGTVAWYFSGNEWSFPGGGTSGNVAVRSSTIGAFYNASFPNIPNRFAENRDYVDIHYQEPNPRQFELPHMCPGGRAEESGSSGMSSGSAAGLAFGMIILGALIGAGGLYCWQRRSSAGRMSVNTDDHAQLATSSGYGST